MRWLSEEELSCTQATLVCVYDERSQTLESTADRFVLVKSRQMIDWYEERFRESPPPTVLEIGIFKGGSVVLFAEPLASAAPGRRRHHTPAAPSS